MFADVFTLKLGEVTVKGRRLTLREIRDNQIDAASGNITAEKCIELIRGHVTLEDGASFDPLDLSSGQLRTLIGELILPKEGRGISDFIGLLS